MAILQLRQVRKVWRIERTGEETVALDGVTLDVAAGELLVILGPSGCGKSTLLQILAGLEAPSAGEIHSLGSDGRQKLTCTVFHEYALFPWRTVFQNILFGPEVRACQDRSGRPTPGG